MILFNNQYFMESKALFFSWLWILNIATHSENPLNIATHPDIFHGVCIRPVLFCRSAKSSPPKKNRSKLRCLYCGGPTSLGDEKIEI